MAISSASIGRVRTPMVVKFDSTGASIVGMRETAEAIAKKIDAVIDSVANATPAAITDALKPIYDLSQEYVPVDTHALEQSAFIETRQGVAGPKVVIGYAKYGTPWYAAYVHEATWMRHAEGKYAKFLERAVNERIHIFKARLAENMRTKVVGSAGGVR
jgi:hypothetical protein